MNVSAVVFVLACNKSCWLGRQHWQLQTKRRNRKAYKVNTTIKKLNKQVKTIIMKKTIHTITLAITAIMLLGLNQVIAQEQKKSKSVSNMALNPIPFVSQLNNGSSNLTSVGKKAPKFMLDSMSSINWDTLSKTYTKNPFGLKYYYDANGNNTLLTFYVTNPLTQEIMLFGKYTNTFNNNKIILVKSTLLNLMTNQWENNNMNEYAYDSKGNNTYYRESDWNSNSNNYEPNTSYSYTYNLSNKVTMEIDTIFGGSTPQINKTDYSYDSKGNNTLKTTYNWDGTTWQKSSKDEYTFDANNNNTLHISYNWNTTWVGNEKIEYTMDASGNPISTITYSWNITLNQWINKQKRSATFNSSINISDVAVLFAQHGNAVSIINQNAPTNQISQNYTNGQWVNDSKTNYYYKDFAPSTSIKEMKLLQTNVYPNPSSGNFTVSANQAFTKIDVYDITGKLVESIQNFGKSNTLEMNLSTLNNGIYFINAETVNGAVSKSKIIISK